VSDSDRKFSIQEIREYLKGCLMIRTETDGMGSVRAHDNIDRNFALKCAIHELEDHEDGIAAVTDRVAGGGPKCDVDEDDEHMFGDHIRRLIRVFKKLRG